MPHRDEDDQQLRPKRKSAEAASQVLKNILSEEERESGSKRKKREERRDVRLFGDLFRCSYASEDSQLIEDDERDVRLLFVSVEWLKDFGPIKAGTISNAVAFDGNTGKFTGRR